MASKKKTPTRKILKKKSAAKATARTVAKTVSKKTQKTTGVKRACSYCGKKGHNSRSHAPGGALDPALA